MAMMTSAERFFYEHAAHSFTPGIETVEQGRARSAAALAAAEEWGRNQGYSSHWSHDPLPDPEIKWQLWQCTLYSPHGDPVASVGGVDFGSGGTPWGDPNRRVVEAELLREAMPAPEPYQVTRLHDETTIRLPLYCDSADDRQTLEYAAIAFGFLVPNGRTVDGKTLAGLIRTHYDNENADAVARVCERY